MIDDEEKGNSGSHVEDTDDSTGDNNAYMYDAQERSTEQRSRELSEGGNSKLRDVTTIDEIHIKNKLQESVARILDQVHETMDGLLSEKVEDEEEIAAKAHLQQLLPTLLSEWEQVDRDLQALMMKYGLQPKFGRSQVMVKVE